VQPPAHLSNTISNHNARSKRDSDIHLSVAIKQNQSLFFAGRLNFLPPLLYGLDAQ
jgi:hypothetical protein